MFDPTFSDKETLPDDLTVQTVEPEVEVLFPFLLAETEKSIVSHKVLPPMAKKVRFTFLLSPDEQTTPRMPVWLHELVGWGVFLAILGSFLGIQIYFNRFLSNPLSQILIIFSVLAEIGLLWRWDQYWY